MQRSQPHGDGATQHTSNALARARQLGTAGLRATLAWQVARTFFKVVFLAALATLVGGAIESDGLSASALVVGLTAVLLAATAGLLADRRQSAAEAAVADGIRVLVRGGMEGMAARVLQARPAGALIAGLQRHPESLAALVVGHRAAAMMLGIGPLLAALAVLFVSWQAGLALLLASPVMVVFFILVGGTIHSRAAVQEKSFGQLAAQFEDRIRTLPTILAGHGLDHERQKLEARMRAYAQSTMGVLKVAFLNAGIIDFFSSLSIALLAVFLGVGHLKLIQIPGFSGFDLWQSLFILMLAPEFFAPFRRYAEQYHAKAEGNAAAAALDDLLKAGPAAALPESNRLAVGGRIVRHADLRLPEKGLVAITGPSGAGKSTLLRSLAGVDPSEVSMPDAARDGIDWISTDIHVPAGTLGGALSWNRTRACPTKLLLAASRVGLLDDRMLPGGLDARIEAGGDNLSGGQRLRIGIARALLSNRAIFADEPTAKLDPRNAGRVRLALFDGARDRLVVVATHDPELAKCADTLLDLGEGQGAGLEAVT